MGNGVHGCYRSATNVESHYDQSPLFNLRNECCCEQHLFYTFNNWLWLWFMNVTHFTWIGKNDTGNGEKHATAESMAWPGSAWRLLSFYPFPFILSSQGRYFRLNIGTGDSADITYCWNTAQAMANQASHYLDVLHCFLMSMMILCNGSPSGHFKACSINPSWYALNAAGSFLNICKIHNGVDLAVQCDTARWFKPPVDIK